MDPVALGGLTTVERCRLLCRFHQDLAARKVYGDEWMDRFTRRREPPAPSKPAHPSS